MTTRVADAPTGSPALPSRALVPFVAITFGVTWGTIGVYIFWPDFAAARFGEISGSHPAFFLATWGPAIAGVTVVTAHAGAAGLRDYFARLLLWRCPFGWALFVAVGVPLVFVAGSLLKGGPLISPVSSEGLVVVLGASLLFLFLGPIEELGWRGVAQPLLQRHMAPIWAGVLIGGTWGLWHLPAFHLSGTVQSGWSFTPFFVGNVALAVIVTPLFNSARGSILLPMLFHWQLINPIWPDAQPWDTWLFVGVAAGVVWVNRHTMFTRLGGVTEVISRRRGPRPER